MTLAEVDRWHPRLHKAGVGECQIRNLYTLLRAAFGQAMRWELISSNPVASAPPERRKRMPRGVMSVDEDSRAFEAAAEVHDAALLVLRLAAVAGARRSHGVLVTTARFSEAVRKAALGRTPTIDLIDGDRRLAELCLRQQVGVSTRPVVQTQWFHRFEDESLR